MSDRMVWYILQYFFCNLRPTKGIESTLKAMRLLVSEIDVLGLLWKWPPFCKMAFTMSDRWCDTFGNTFSQIFASQNLYIESKLKVLCLLVSEIVAILENGSGPNRHSTGVIWLGTIAKFTCFGIMYMCAKFHALTTKCTIFL